MLSDWRKANVTPIYPKRETYNHTSCQLQDSANLRPISLTRIACKLLEHIFMFVMMKHWNQHGILNPNLHCFQNGRSYDTQLLRLVSDAFPSILIAVNLDNADQTDALILNFAKSFDEVAHHIFGNKLHVSDVHRATLGWIEQFLTDRAQWVVSNGKSSTLCHVTSGVPQGTVVDTSRFLILICNNGWLGIGRDNNWSISMQMTLSCTGRSSELMVR